MVLDLLAFELLSNFQTQLLARRQLLIGRVELNAGLFNALAHLMSRSILCGKLPHGWTCWSCCDVPLIASATPAAASAAESMA